MDEMNKPVTNTSTPPILMIGMVLGVVILIGLLIFFLRKPTPEPGIPEQTPEVLGSPILEACFLKNLTIDNPQPLQVVEMPFTVTGTVNNGENKNCNWVIFEAQAGTLSLEDSQGNVIGEGILEAQGEWMTEVPVSVSGTITLKQQPTDMQGWTLKITEEDPSGMGEVDQLFIPLQGKAVE